MIAKAHVFTSKEVRVATTARKQDDMAALNEQQKYLLGRLPSRYDLKEDQIPDTADVNHARKVIEAHDKKISEHKCSRQDKFKKATNAAREAIYFKKPDEALALIKSLETDFPTKCT